ncbi:aldose epimerase family protein [Jiulongibacter sp. NS-SX5]|uniref:aldose epimerase family protein n=1 Tax=Jiulongibacter sp. NS-SX5 TaxID=3463854 RepID=UPI004057F4B3
MNLTLTGKDGNQAIIELTGATLSHLTLGNEDLIKYPLKEDDPKKGYPSAFLFPFPNRIRDGRYVFEGKEYSLDLNDTDSNNAIHGFVAFENFEVLEQSDKKAKLQYSYNGQHEGYPFPFTFTVEFSLSSNKLSVKAEGENTGENNMPVGFAWHPYFGFGSEPIGEMTVKAPRREKMELSDRYIPTGEFETERAGVIPLKNNILDNVFRIADVDSAQEVSIEVRYKKKKLIVSQKAGKSKLNYFVLYTPASRDCIAIEPQSCNTNAFNNEEGLVILKPGKKIKYEMSVSLEG